MKAKHILVPTDFSEASKEAIKMAARFIDLYDSTIDLMHVVPLMSYYEHSMEHMGVPFDMEKELYPKVLKEANEMLHEVAAELLPKEHRGQLINVVGRKVSQVIADQVNKGPYDLVIMTNKGSHKTDHIRSGTTEKVIRFSEKPVLSLTRSMGMSEIHEILVPVDGSDESATPLVEAFDLALAYDAQITLMHIIEPYTLGMEVLPMTIEDDKAVYNSMIDNINSFFEKHPDMGMHVKRNSVDFEDYLVRKVDNGTQSIKFVSIVKKGFSAHTEICDYANENADLVVMSTHGRTGIARVLLGSTTGIVAQHLQKPLLTLRPMMV